MTLSAKEILARLDAGEDPGSVLMALRQPEDVALEQRAAALRWFDRGTFEVLRTQVVNGTNVDFDRFVQQAAIEVAPGKAECYRIRDGERRTLLDSWRESPEFQTFNASLAEYHQRQQPNGSVEELQHLCAANGTHFAAAHTLFRRLFADAESRLDIARCTELIDIVDQPEHRLPADFKADLVRHRCYVQARTLWAEEYFRTAAYYNRKTLEDALTALVAADAARWILQIYAVGGMGKTTFIRWATSRFMAPARIACARLDFDHEHPTLLTDQLWWLVLKLARELNVQIPGGPFTELVKELAELERQSRDGAQLSAAHQTRYNEDALSRLTSSIVESAADTTIVILCDTLEQVELHHPAPLLALVERFAELHRECPNVRLLLSGRYNLEDESRLSGYKARFGAVTSTLEVDAFSAQEGHDYLTHSRGLPDDERVQAIVARSDGVPFKLSLFATIAQDDSELTAQAIRELEDVHVEYLIKRVVDRIGDGLLQWVIRHGVVPRRLTRAFLEDVMAPLLVDIQAGRSRADTGTDQLLPAHLRSKDRFRTGLLSDGALDVDRVWQELRRYAADYSWISEPKDWPDTLVFHGDVINPMRRLLQEQHAFDLLHERASAHYETRAEQDRANWAHWMCEAIYHRFQKDGPSAKLMWEVAYGRAVAAGDMRGGRQLAEELLGAEYVDEDKPRRRRDGRPMVTRDLLATAAFRAAWTGVHDARLRKLPFGDAAYAAADRRLSEAERWQKECGHQLLEPVRITLVRAALAVVRAPVEAARLLDSVRAEVTPEQRAEFEELEGDVRSNREPAAAATHYRKAIAGLTALAPTASVSSARYAQLRMKLSDAAQQAGDHWAASEAARDALKTAENLGDVALAADAQLRVANALLAAGEARRAVSVVSRGHRRDPSQSDDQSAALDEVGLRALCELGEPLRARGRASRLFRDVFKNSAPTKITARLAYGYAIKASLHELFYENAEAAAAWRRARECWDALVRPDQAFHCTMRCATLLVRKERELETAAQMISDAEREAAALGPSFLLEVSALEVERLSHVNPHRATVTFDQLLAQRGRNVSDSPEAVAAIARQAFVMGYREREAAEWLASALAPLSHAAARLRVLKTRDRGLFPWSKEANILAPVLEPAIKGILARGRHVVDECAIATVYALWWLGRKDEAKSLLDRLAGRLRSAASLYPLVELRVLAQRLQLEPRGPLFDKTLPRKFLDEFAAHPALRGHFLLIDAYARKGKGTPIKEIEALLGDPAWLSGDARRWLSHLRHPKLFKDKDRPRVPASSVSYLDFAPSTASPAAAEREASDRPGPDYTPPDVGTWVIAIARDGELVTIDRNGERSLERPIDERFHELTGASVAGLTASGNTTPASTTTMRLVAAHGAGEQIRRLVLDDADIDALTSRVDLRLEMAHSLFGAIPWELASGADGKRLVEHPNVRSLYRAAPSDVSARYLIAEAQAALHDLGNATLKVDQRLGRQTTAALRQFQQSRGLPPSGRLDAVTRGALRRAWAEAASRAERRVLIVQRSRRAQYFEMRGSVISGEDAADFYSEHGWVPEILADPTLEQLRAALANKPDVLHLSASAAENPTLGGVFLDIGRDIGDGLERLAFETAGVRTPMRSEGLSVRALASVLEPLPSRTSPIIVLAPPMPSGPTEATRQLLLRNAFASDLFQLGVTPAIVATGLTESPLEEDTTSARLVAGLSGDTPLREVVATMRAVPRHTGFVRSSAFAVALFVHDADYVPSAHLKPAKGR